MKSVLIRLMLVAVLVAGGLTAVSVSRLVLADVPPRPQGPPLPFSFEEGRAAERLAEALRIPEVAGLHGFVEGAFPLVHEVLAVEALGEGSLLYRWEGSDPARAPILLLAHLDLAPSDGDARSEAGSEVGSEAGSGADRGSMGIYEDGMIRGAGILDGRGPALAILEAVEGLLAQGFTPGRTVLVAFGHDRYRGGIEGARRIAQRLEETGVRPEWVLGVGEGSGVATGAVPGVRAPVGLVATAEKRRLTVALEGRDGADADLAGRGGAEGAGGADADLAGRVAAALEADPLPARLEDPYRELIGMLAGRMDPGTGLLATNMWLFRRPLLWALAADEVWVTQVRSVVEPVPNPPGWPDPRAEPDPRAGNLLTLQFTPWDSSERLLAGIRERAGGVGVEVSVREPPRPGTHTPDQSAGRTSSAEGSGFTEIREAVHRIFPDVVGVGPYLATTPTDARHFEAVADDVYRFAPVRAERADLIDPEARAEVLTVRQYGQMVRFYAELLGRS